MEPSEHIQHLAWRVTGRVQGVGFRWWTRRAALRLGLRGSVRNRVDGSVEVEVAGHPHALGEFRALLGEGPMGARVESLEPMPVTGPPPPDFRVLV